MDDMSEERKSELAAQLAGAVRDNKVFLAAVVIPLCLLALLVAARFAPGWSGRAEVSAWLLFLVFLLASLTEVVVLPGFLIANAAREFLNTEGGGDLERFASFYGIGTLGCTTPCVMGLVAYFYSGVFLQGVALFAVGLSGMAYYALRVEAVVSRRISRGGKSFAQRLAERQGGPGE